MCRITMPKKKREKKRDKRKKETPPPTTTVGGITFATKGEKNKKKTTKLTQPVDMSADFPSMDKISKTAPKTQQPKTVTPEDVANAIVKGAKKVTTSTPVPESEQIPTTEETRLSLKLIEISKEIAKAEEGMKKAEKLLKHYDNVIGALRAQRDEIFSKFKERLKIEE